MADPPPPLIPQGGRFEGLVDVRGPARIDGEVQGEVWVTGSLWVGAEARLRATVHARDVVVEGAVDGEIVAPEKIELRATARARASLHTARLVLAEGAHFEGRCHTLAADSGVPEGIAPAPDSAAGTP